MKKLLCVLFAVMLICIGTVPCFAAGPRVAVNTVKSAAVGDTITVSVVLSSNTGLGGIDFTVKFNTSEFQLVSDSVSVSSLFMADTNIGSTSIRYAGISAETVKSNGTLMTFDLKVLKTGGKITLSVNDALNGNDEDITSSISTSGATVNCSHAKASWVITKKPTCTEKGVETRTCTCGNVSTRDIAPTGHTYGKWVVVKEATETQKGLKIATCSVCGDKKEQVIPLVVKKETTTETVTETETSTEINETSTEFTEPTTPEETTSEILKDEPVTEVSVEDAVKSATVKTAIITVVSVLGIEAVVGLAVFLMMKNKKKK